MKQRIRRLMRPAGILLGALVIVALLAFSARSTGTTPVRELAVTVESAEGIHFIDENTVREHVLAAVPAVIGAPLREIDLVTIEQNLRRIGCVANADAFHTMDGVLHVNVRQREPIVRVINADGSGFYITRDGWTMPLSERYTARVLVVTGELHEPFAQLPPLDLTTLHDSMARYTYSRDILAVARAIVADQLWNALFDHAVIDTRGEIELVPRIGDQRVRIGRPPALEESTSGEAQAVIAARLEKLRAFYLHGIPQRDWRLYGIIDTRFDGQVVCTKRTGPARSGSITEKRTTNGASAPTHR